MFIAEAPGRLGAERTGIPLFGDRTGDRFEDLLVSMGLNRSEVFISNAVLCNPRNKDGNNDVPKKKEIENCSTLLRRTIDVVNPTVVVTMGRVALDALALIEPHQFSLSKFTGKMVPWNERWLGILYHPAPRTVVHRSWSMQIRDARKLASRAKEQVRHVEKHTPPIHRKPILSSMVNMAVPPATG